MSEEHKPCPPEIKPDNFDENGHFKKGNQISVGNKSKAIWRRKMESAFRNAITEQDFISIVMKIITQAKRGDSNAQKEILKRVLGEEKYQIDITSAEERISFTLSKEPKPKQEETVE